MARDDPQLKLRLPPALKERIERAAYRNVRTINAEVVARLERSFPEIEEGIEEPHKDEMLVIAEELDRQIRGVVRRHTKAISQYVKKNLIEIKPK